MDTDEKVIPKQPVGWIPASEYYKVNKAWMVEVPEQEVAAGFRVRAAEHAEEARTVLGLPPIELRWYRATHCRAFAEEQCRRTKQVLEQQGITREVALKDDTSNLQGFAVGTVTEAMLADYPGKVIRIENAEEYQLERMPEWDPDNPIIYLMGDPRAFDEAAPLDALIAHEAVHLVQFRAEYPMRLHEPMAYEVSRHWNEFQTGFNRLDDVGRAEIHRLLQHPEKARYALDVLSAAAAYKFPKKIVAKAKKPVKRQVAVPHRTRKVGKRC